MSVEETVEFVSKWSEEYPEMVAVALHGDAESDNIVYEK